MLRKAGLLLFACAALITSVNGYQSDFVTYEWLTSMASNSGYTDHIPHWRRLFNTKKIRGFLECGCGYSTAYFLDKVEKVVSIEYITPGYGDDWYKVCLSLFSDRSNWIPMTYNENFRSNSFNNACAYQCSTHKDYSLTDPTYLKELDSHFKTVIANAKSGGYEIDVAFVDPGIYIRGDLVKLLLKNNIPIVTAHDTNSDRGTSEEENLYGWNKVTTPANYIKIFIPFGQGTTFWVREDLSDVIISLIGYRDAVMRIQESKYDDSFEKITELADMPNFLPRK